MHAEGNAKRQSGRQTSAGATVLNRLMEGDMHGDEARDGMNKDKEMDRDGNRHKEKLWMMER